MSDEEILLEIRQRIKEYFIDKIKNSETYVDVVDCNADIQQIIKDVANERKIDIRELH